MRRQQRGFPQAGEPRKWRSWDGSHRKRRAVHVRSFFPLGLFPALASQVIFPGAPTLFSSRAIVGTLARGKRLVRSVTQPPPTFGELCVPSEPCLRRRPVASLQWGLGTEPDDAGCPPFGSRRCSLLGSYSTSKQTMGHHHPSGIPSCFDQRTTLGLPTSPRFQ